jgi:hypothetical protein
MYNLIRIVIGKNRSHGKNFYINHNYPECTIYLTDVNNNIYLLTLAVIIPLKNISSISNEKIEGIPYISRTLKNLEKCKLNNKLPYSRARYYYILKKYHLPLNIENLTRYSSNIISWDDLTLSINIDKNYLMEDKRFRDLENPLEGEYIVRKLHDKQFRHYFHITPEAGNLLQSAFAFLFEDLWKNDDIYSKYTKEDIFRIKVKKHLDKLPRDMLPDYYLIQSKYKIGAYFMSYMINNLIHLKFTSSYNDYIINVDDIKVVFYASRFDKLFKEIYPIYFSKYIN